MLDCKYSFFITDSTVGLRIFKKSALTLDSPIKETCNQFLAWTLMFVPVANKSEETPPGFRLKSTEPRWARLTQGSSTAGAAQQYVPRC